MNKMNFPFSYDDYLEYNSTSGKHEGRVRFISEYYITLCIAVYEKCEEDSCCFKKENEVCIVVYPHDWDKLNLLNTK